MAISERGGGGGARIPLEWLLDGRARRILSSRPTVSRGSALVCADCGCHVLSGQDFLHQVAFYFTPLFLLGTSSKGKMRPTKTFDQVKGKSLLLLIAIRQFTYSVS